MEGWVGLGSDKGSHLHFLFPMSSLDYTYECIPTAKILATLILLTSILLLHVELQQLPCVSAFLQNLSAAEVDNKITMLKDAVARKMQWLAQT